MKFLRSIFSVLSPVSFLLMVWRKGEYVGTDQVGNKYYRADPRKGYKHEQRWVLYAGTPEASSIPPEWHGWIHHQTDIIPSGSGLSYRQSWQLPAAPNRTGTNLAYNPPGHTLSGGKRAAATGDYQAWRPE